MVQNSFVRSEEIIGVRFSFFNVSAQRNLEVLVDAAIKNQNFRSCFGCDVHVLGKVYACIVLCCPIKYSIPKR